MSVHRADRQTDRQTVRQPANRPHPQSRTDERTKQSVDRQASSQQLGKPRCWSLGEKRGKMMRESISESATWPASRSARPSANPLTTDRGGLGGPQTERQTLSTATRQDLLLTNGLMSDTLDSRADRNLHNAFVSHVQTQNLLVFETGGEGRKLC